MSRYFEKKYEMTSIATLKEFHLTRESGQVPITEVRCPICNFLLGKVSEAQPHRVIVKCRKCKHSVPIILDVDN